MGCCNSSSSDQIIYTGPTLTCIPLATNDNLTLALQRINENFCYLQPTDPPPLDKINEGNGLGIIIRGRTSANYGNIGLNAVDLSFNSSASSTTGATGLRAFASGFETIASGENATASGWGAEATGLSSNAEGMFTRAYGNDGSHAEGYDTEASGENAHAEGNGTTASGNAAHAEGGATEASGRSSHAEGESTYAEGIASHVGGTYSTAQGDYSFARGTSVTALGKNSFAHGQTLTSYSFDEAVFGAFNTDYIPLSATSWQPTDRLFVVGNGVATGSQSDAMIILKNGLATLPSVTNALIAAGSTKSIVTREYLEANMAVTPDATAAVKGKLKLTNDLGGTADLPTTPTALHKTTNESWTGIKSTTNTGSGLNNGLKLINNANFGGSAIVDIECNGNHPGILIVGDTPSFRLIDLRTSATDFGPSALSVTIDPGSNSNGIEISNNGNIEALNIASFGSADSIYSAAINGDAITSIIGIGDTNGTGFTYVGKNYTNTTFTVSKLGAITASGNFLSTGTNNQIMVTNGGGEGVRMGACSNNDAFLTGSVTGDGVLIAHQKLFLAVGFGSIPVAYTEAGNLGVGVYNPTAKVDIAPSLSTAASIRIRQGVAPTSPNDGDMWLEDNSLTGLKIRINGVTRTVNLT
jgi:hypothetical protein